MQRFRRSCASRRSSELYFSGPGQAFCTASVLACKASSQRRPATAATRDRDQGRTVGSELSQAGPLMPLGNSDRRRQV